MTNATTTGGATPQLLKAIADTRAAQAAAGDAAGRLRDRDAGAATALTECGDACAGAAERMESGENYQETAERAAEMCATAAKALAPYQEEPELQTVMQAILTAASSCKAVASTPEPSAMASRDKIVADTFPASDPPSSPTSI